MNHTSHTAVNHTTHTIHVPDLYHVRLYGLALHDDVLGLAKLWNLKTFNSARAQVRQRSASKPLQEPQGGLDACTGLRGNSMLMPLPRYTVFTAALTGF